MVKKKQSNKVAVTQKGQIRSPYLISSLIVALVAILFGVYSNSSFLFSLTEKPLDFYYEELLRWIPNNSASSPSSSSGIVAAYYNIKNRSKVKPGTKGIKYCSSYADSSLVWLDEMTVEEASSIFGLDPQVIVGDEAATLKKVDNFMIPRGGCVFVDTNLGFELIRRPLQKQGFNEFVREKSGGETNLASTKSTEMSWMVESKSQSSDWKDTIFLNRHKPWRAYQSNYCIPLSNNYGDHRTRQGTHTIYECKSSYVKMIVFKDESSCLSYLSAKESESESDPENDLNESTIDSDFDEDSILLEHDYSFQNYRRFCIG